MLAPFRYTTLISSLPHQPALFTERQTVISRLRLESRLTMLAEDDARLLRSIEALLSWSRQEFELSDQAIVELNIPTGVPLVYELDSHLARVSSRYLGDPEAAKARAEAVARQTERKK